MLGFGLSNKRKNFLINPNFQLRFIIYIASFALLGIGVLYLSNFIYFYKLTLEGQQLGLSPDHIYFRFINEQKVLLHMIFLGMSIVVFGGLFVAGLLLSHKIAGPMYRLNVYIDNLTKQGKAADLKFRDYDFFPEVADGINKLTNFYEREKDTVTKSESKQNIKNNININEDEAKLTGS